MRCQTHSELSHHPPFAGALGRQESRTGDASSDLGTLGCVLSTVIYHSLSSSSSPTTATRPSPLRTHLCAANLSLDTIVSILAAIHTT